MAIYVDLFVVLRQINFEFSIQNESDNHKSDYKKEFGTYFKNLPNSFFAEKSGSKEYIVPILPD